ncbi:hypothetical protein [Nitrospira sp. Kam-Ns4a]
MPLVRTLEPLAFHNTDARLPAPFFPHERPTPLSNPHRASFNPAAAAGCALFANRGPRRPGRPLPARLWAGDGMDAERAADARAGGEG